MKKPSVFIGLIASSVIFLSSCKNEIIDQALNPDTAPKVSVDRFSSDHGTLMIRTATNGMPGPNAPINFDAAPFVTLGLGPTGQMVSYYNFDVQSRTTVPVYVFFKEGSTTPVEGQLNVINQIPGDAGYSDLWHMAKVTVPADYIANTVTSEAEIIEKGYSIEYTNTVVNCPVVPEGSTAMHRVGGGSNSLHRGWYKDQICFYFTFEEAALSSTSGLAPISPIYVTFNINPDMPDGGPPSGFVTEPSTMQTHNVLATLPGDLMYSPLWSVQVYSNSDFSAVSNLSTATSATILGSNVMNVNCPVATIN